MTTELTPLFIRSRSAAELQEILERLAQEAERMCAGGVPPDGEEAAALLGTANRIAAEVARRKGVRS